MGVELVVFEVEVNSLRILKVRAIEHFDVDYFLFDVDYFHFDMCFLGVGYVGYYSVVIYYMSYNHVSQKCTFNYSPTQKVIPAYSCLNKSGLNTKNS